MALAGWSEVFQRVERTNHAPAQKGLPQTSHCDGRSARSGAPRSRVRHRGFAWPNRTVSLLIETDRDQLLELLVARIRGGLDYPTLLGGIAEASVRQVRPYPGVGFKYNAFMVLQAVHQATRLGRLKDRWLAPVLWAAYAFKGSQASEQRSGSWALGPVRKQLVPPAHKAEGAFRDAMERWDPEAADAAVAGLARSLPRGT